MILFSCILSLSIVAATSVQGQNEQVREHRVFPAAQTETYGSGTVGFVKPKELVFRGSDSSIDNPVIHPAIQRFAESLYLFPDFKEDYEVNPENEDLFQIKTVEIQIRSTNFKLYHGVDESYDIQIDNMSQVAILRAETVFGGLHALESLSQLLNFGWMEKDDEPVYLIRGIPLSIVDEPAYSFRGLMIDTGRHFLPMNLILDTLTTMSMNKMNILHWHLVDEQFFPYQMETYPEISKKGSYHPRRIYTTDDIKLVIDEAYKLGIRVIPEVDLPGHTRVIAKSHPEFMAFCPDPASLVDATKEEVYDFVENIYKDLSNLFPDDMVHVGGDEVKLTCWEKSEPISKWMKDHNMTDPVELYEYFETRLLRIVDNFEKTPIVWQEVFNLNLTITPSTIVDVWKGFDVATIEAAAAQNFNVILSGCWYLDHLNNKWQDYYECDPRNFTGNTDLMIGGHASMWGEHVDASNFVSRTWPRASAAAERLWTGNVTTAQVNIKERIHLFRCRMVQQGIAAGPTGPGFCPHEVPYVKDRVGKKKKRQEDQNEKPLIA
jgi:hexosaminidase